MAVSFAGSFKSEELADADIVLVGPAAEQDPSLPPPCKRRCTEAVIKQEPDVAEEVVEGCSHQQLQRQVVASFPAHRLLLCRCEYFKAQVERWQVATSSGTSSSSRPQLELSLDNPDQQAAAEAVIASLYLVDNPLRGLSKMELVHAIIIADRLQATYTAEHGVRQLLADRTPTGLPDDTLDALASLDAWPSCLLPALQTVARTWSVCPSEEREQNVHRVERMVLSALGNLSAVWGDEQLEQTLLQLPEPALWLLLASDELTADSEDTVLYTAAEYERSQTRARIWQALPLGASLADLIRCQYLSLSCLSALALTTDREHLMYGYKKQLKQLLSLQLAHCGAGNADLMEGYVQSVLQDNIRRCPPSWSLPQRRYQPIAEVSRAWSVPVQDIKQLYLDAHKTSNKQELLGPKTPPLLGRAWCCWLSVEPTVDSSDDISDSSSNSDSSSTSYKIAWYAGVDEALAGTFARASLRLHISAGSLEIEHTEAVVDVNATEGFGWSNVLGFGGMSGGWDEEAWSDRGLSLEGNIEFRLTVAGVNTEHASTAV